ncbi:SpoIIE family protein phosphatase [Kineococcus rubinsiae]|uniref:SpoIIE family protein phosphatase n=1 Tax=Kineococcus rubinsiae TaxID=2609562 RepID=UPI001431F401|nr:GAF domain-containing SpoIIE family protein phosphatase [Kineococcus rubinsiae]NIZ90470.1 SpoIIE family protein phosphatase [Kineococcus rubinsiae]
MTDGPATTYVDGPAPQLLPSVMHGRPGAVLLVRNADATVLVANPVAEQLAPGQKLPCGLEEWSRAAGLQAEDGSRLDRPDQGQASSPLSRVAAGEPIQGERVTALRGTDLSGAREPLWVVGLPLADAAAEGLTDLSLVVLLPMREQVAVAEAQESAAQLRSRAVVASDLSFTISDPSQPDNPLVWVNPAFERVTGYGKEVLGRNCRFLQGEDTDRASVDRIRTALAKGDNITELLLNYRKDGTAFWNEVVISPVRDATGTVTHHVGVQYDVTARIHAESERDAALAEARSARGRLEFLSRVTDGLVTLLDPDEALHVLPSLVVPDFALWAFASVLDAAGRIQHVSATHTDEARAADAARLEELLATGLLPSSVSSRVLRGELGPTLRRIVGADELHDGAAEGEFTELLERLGLGSVLVVPLRARGAITGCLTMFSGSGRPPFDEDDLSTAVDLGYRAGLALENARLYAQQRKTSEVLQRSLLSPPQHSEGLAVATRYYPAAEAAQVGGDWYDAFVQPDGCTTVVIGDVMGHDVSAAAAMGQLRTLVRGIAFDRGAQPAEVVGRLDTVLHGLGMTTLATAIVLQISEGEGGVRRARWCVAGHLPAVLVHPDGEVTQLSGTGIVVGLGPDQRRHQHEADLLPGSIVLLYTDGLVERRDRTMGERLDELHAAVADLADRPLDELCDELIARMLPDGSDDDVAVVVVRVLETPAA